MIFPTGGALARAWPRCWAHPQVIQFSAPLASYRSRAHASGRPFRCKGSGKCLAASPNANFTAKNAMPAAQCRELERGDCAMPILGDKCPLARGEIHSGETPAGGLANLHHHERDGIGG